ncbi:MAG: sigma-70 family RNA polymerase sigma factor, partial [Clostridia bacterium]|nr:sigma-70 family RNA polymerase sigma factor [Clostridia bacterium]
MDKLECPENYEKNIIDRLVIEGALKEFPQREQKIIILRYFKQKTQSQIAQSLGISQVQVSRLEKKILKELKEKICG